jgi:hypothetical protein
LTADDARSNDNYALCISADYGYLDVLAYLLERFGLTTEDAWVVFCRLHQFVLSRRYLGREYLREWLQ